MTPTQINDPAPDGTQPERSRPSRAKVAVLATSGALVLATGLGVAGLAMADPTPTPSSPSGSYHTGPGGGPGQRGGPQGEHRQSDLAARLTEKLGLDQATVTKALQAVRQDRPGPGTSTEEPDADQRRAELAAALAEKLNVPEADVATALEEIESEATAARRQALQTRLDEAVKAGTLSQAEADAVLKAAEAGVIPLGGPR